MFPRSARALPAALALLCLSLSPVAAQDAEPAPSTPDADAPELAAGPPEGFEDAMSAILAEAGMAHGLIRCAALFRAFRVYAGDLSEIGEMAAERETDMGVFSVIVWQNENGIEDNEEAFAAIVPIVEGATELFFGRMIENQRATGTVFDTDLEGNLGYCNALRDQLLAPAEE